VGINWSGKRRWIAGLLLLAGFLVMFNIPPVIPNIQLPGEVYPGGRQILGLPMTNSLMGSILTWILIVLLIVYVSRAKPKDGSEAPRGGFYNLFELLFEGLYGFIQGVAGGKYLVPIFKIFFTIFLLVLISNWQELVPIVDSVGFLEPHLDKVTHEPLKGYDTTQSGSVYILNPKCPWVSPAEAATQTADQVKARVAAGCTSGIGAATTTTEATTTTGAAAATTTTGAAATTTEATTTTAEPAGEKEYAPGDPSVPWQVLPYLRSPSTDLNFTASLAVIAVIMTQVMGFRALGLGYLTKFFNFKTLFNSPLGGIDVAVGLLELIGELARLLSFSFRLLGNIFAGSILLFVMSFLIPFLPWPFFLLEFFVGALQAFVFGLLTAIFMNLATVSHVHDEEHLEEGVVHEVEHQVAAEVH
jgi:F-type H+-transporting ATPase subunit a